MGRHLTVAQKRRARCSVSLTLSDANEETARMAHTPCSRPMPTRWLLGTDKDRAALEKVRQFLPKLNMQRLYDSAFALLAIHPVNETFCSHKNLATNVPGGFLDAS